MHENFRQKTYKLMRNFPDIALASVRISLPESKEFQHREEPDYALSQYLSDVGGAMGLVLGASLVSVLELFDCLIYGQGVLYSENHQTPNLILMSYQE